MILTGSYCEITKLIRVREYNKGTDIPITVGILIAEFTRQFCKENILYQLERFDNKSGPLIDFYIPGYCKTTDVDPYAKHCYTYKNDIYSFSPTLFNEFVSRLEHQGVIITGGAQFILIKYANNHFVSKDMMVFDLEKDQQQGKIDSVKLFFDSVFEIASRTTDFEIFRKEISRSRATKAVFDFFRENLPATVLSKLIS